jgi:glutathione S-transferase
LDPNPRQLGKDRSSANIVALEDAAYASRFNAALASLRPLNRRLRMDVQQRRTLYVGSGSPYAWRVWLALEHKALPYDLRVLSFSGGDLKAPEFAAMNPRCKVPVLDDGGFVIYESAAVVDYIADAYANVGAPLFPTDVKARAVARRKIREADEYVAQSMERLVERVLFTPREEWDHDKIAKSRERFLAELAYFENELTGDFLVGELGAADFTLYPLLALALRMESRTKPDLDIAAHIGPRLTAWMRRIEALPFFAKTYPPHWRTAT